MKRILVYRFSAMGDVVMLLPVLKGLLDANPELEIHFLTRSFLFPVFKGIDRLHLVNADLNGEHKGMKGLFKLYKNLKEEINPDLVFDLHQVLRTFNLNLYFRWGGTKVYTFNKGQLEKRKAVRSKSHQNLPGTCDRYLEVFREAGLTIKLPDTPLLKGIDKKEALNKLHLDDQQNLHLIGIAPFAKHPQKVWGIKKVEQLIRELGSNEQLRFILFGGGKEEIAQLDQLAGKLPKTLVAAHFLKLEDELEVLSQLDLMISMDSANMHLAAMAGIPVISIWGATHPSLGFAPYRQASENQIQYEGPELNCRPCSVYGNKKCKYGDVRCMEYVSVSSVEEKVKQILFPRK